MAAKNVIGPVCIAATYGLLKAGGGSGSFIAQLAAKLGLVASTGSGGSGNGAAAAAAAAGDAAATLALACWCSTLLFPFVVRMYASKEKECFLSIWHASYLQLFKIQFALVSFFLCPLQLLLQPSVSSVISLLDYVQCDRCLLLLLLLHLKTSIGPGCCIRWSVDR